MSLSISDQTGQIVNDRTRDAIATLQSGEEDFSKNEKSTGARITERKRTGRK
jgi:hypothetical protein